MHAGDDGLGGLDLVHRDMRKGLHRIDLDGIGFGEAINLLRRNRSNASAWAVAEIDEIERVEMRAVAPVVGAGLVLGALADRVFNQLEWAGAIRPGTERAFLVRIEDEHRVMEKVFGYGDLRRGRVKPHGEGVDLF